MSFLNFTAQGTEKKKIPLVFVRPLLSDIEADAVAGKKVPTSGGWIQLHTFEGGVKFTPKRTTSTTYNQQEGDVDLYQDDCKYELEVNISQLDLEILQDVMNMDPSASAASDVLLYKANRGLKLTNMAVSFLIYDKNDDEENAGTPDVTKDAETLVILKAAPASGDMQIALDGNQNSARLTFNCLGSKSTGAANGVSAVQGPFTAL